MIWLQALPAFLVWILYILWRRPWAARSREHYGRTPRAARILAMAGSLLLSGGALIGGMLLLDRIGAISPENGLTVTGIFLVTIAGLAFIHFQVIAFALTLSLALENETRRGRPTSDLGGSSET